MSSLFVWLIEADVAARTATRALLDACHILTEEPVSLERLKQALAVSERRPDLIICGEQLVEGRDSGEVMALLNERWSGDVPMLILVDAPSRYDIGVGKTNILPLGKPVDPQELIHAISRLCFPLASAVEAE
jgi:hypothetical protein